MLLKNQAQKLLLFENYNTHSWYWELVETVRKVVLTSGLILVGGESRAYVGLACVMSGPCGMFFAYKRPIVDPFENRLMLTSLAVTFVNLGIGAVSKTPPKKHTFGNRPTGGPHHVQGTGVWGKFFSDWTSCG